MIYLSKGTVQAGSTEKLLFVLYCGQRFELTGETASAWLDGRFDFAEAANRREASVAYAGCPIQQQFFQTASADRACCWKSGW